MNSFLIENSCIARWAARQGVSLKAAMERGEYYLGSISGYSSIWRACRAAVAASGSSFSKLAADAVLPGRASLFIAGILRGLIRFAESKAAVLYRGSVFMDVMGRAVVNSRWVR